MELGMAFPSPHSSICNQFRPEIRILTEGASFAVCARGPIHANGAAFPLLWPSGPRFTLCYRAGVNTLRGWQDEVLDPSVVGGLVSVQASLGHRVSLPPVA